MTITSSHTQDHGAATAPPQRTSRVAITPERAAALHTGYTATLATAAAGAVSVLRDPDKLDARVRVLRATLSSLGIEDITNLGRMQLDKTVHVRPGLRRPGGSEETSAKPGSVLDVDEAIMPATEFVLADDTELRLAPEIRHLTILAVSMEVGRRCTVTWQPATRQPRDRAVNGATAKSYSPTDQTSASAYYSPAGGDGGPGEPGARGDTGQDGPTVEIWALQANRLPTFHLAGGRGGDGGAGGSGAHGGHGAKGLEADANLFKCVRQVGYGGDGGDGGAAGDGGDGGRGGRGGDVTLYLSDATHESVLGAGLRTDLTGGPGGAPSVPGAPGLPGIGGEAGNDKPPACLGKKDRTGDLGRMGQFAGPGSPGGQGGVGRLTAAVITEDEFRDKWTDPQIARIRPSQAHVGDTVMITGNHFTRGITVHMAGIKAATTYVSDTTLQATVPALPSGEVEVVAVDGTDRSNPSAITVVPEIVEVTPSPARVGQTVTIRGSGFPARSRVVFRDTELKPDTISSDGTFLTVTLPAPPSPFEDWGGQEELVVRGPDGVVSGSVPILLRHVLDTGFDCRRHGYGFQNTLSSIRGVATMGTFQDTYGTLEVAANFGALPVLTGSYFAAYMYYFNEIEAGYSTGFSTTAAEAYWGGIDDLFIRYPTMTHSMEELLTVAQGHILSREMLSRLTDQAAKGTRRAETSITEIEGVFRRMITMSPDERRKIAPIMQVMPAGVPLTPSFFTKLGHSHGLLPIRLEYPAVTGESWHRRLVVYDNATPYRAGSESFLTLSYDRDGEPRFTFDHENLDTGTVKADGDKRTSANGWTLSHVSLEQCWLSDVSLPTNFVVLIGAATAVVTNGQGQRFGVAASRVWDELPGAYAAPGVPGVYVLPDEDDLTVTVHGTGTGTYRVMLVNGSTGTSSSLLDVPVTPETVDRLRLRPADGLVRLSTEDPDKAVSVAYGRSAEGWSRALTVRSVPVGPDSAVTLRADPALGEFSLEGSRSWGAAIELAGSRAGEDVRHEYGAHPIDPGATTFTVADWTRLTPDSLKIRRPGATAD